MSIKKQKIAIIGSTGSVGETSLNIISKNKNKFKVDLLACNKNYRLALRQIKKFKPKYVYIEDFKTFNLIKKKLKKILYYLMTFIFLKKK